MRFTIAAAALVGAATASYEVYPPAPPAYNTTTAVETPVYPVETPVEYPTETPAYSTPEVPVYVTKTTDVYETFCPGPTTITTNSKTYTVTEATTLTITDCPCTYVEETKTPEVPVPTYVPEVPEVPYPSKNVTSAAPTVAPTGSYTAPPPDFTGAAAKVGTGLLAVAGALVAFL